MRNFEWDCPYCGRSQIVTDANHCSQFSELSIGTTRYGVLGSAVVAIRCLNTDCNEATVKFGIGNSFYNPRRNEHQLSGEYHEVIGIRPKSFAKPQPTYIPATLVEDYEEACVIRDLSPKAAATLARRCLQGMIRDFCGISLKTLYAEIGALRKQVEDGKAPRGVEPETVDAIDAIRDVGNIGAHMEADISVIIDVDAGEAQALIELIELLFDEWYVARHTRTEKLRRVQAVAAEKKAEIAEGRLQAEHRKAIAAPSEG